MNDNPIQIVLSYRLVDLQLQEDRGLAVVEFDRVMVTEGEGMDRLFLEDRKPHDRVKYQLERREGKWFVMDPGVARVSLPGLMNHYREKSVADPPFQIRNEVLVLPENTKPNFRTPKLKEDLESILRVYKRLGIPVADQG
ncbi:MAG: hypothetical protein HQL56_16490 [Magnetococcales bacterium]|nr:hypothetical protein [Magnetococcales bacterium]